MVELPTATALKLHQSRCTYTKEYWLRTARFDPLVGPPCPSNDEWPCGAPLIVSGNSFPVFVVSKSVPPDVISGSMFWFISSGLCGVSGVLGVLTDCAFGTYSVSVTSGCVAPSLLSNGIGCDRKCSSISNMLSNHMCVTLHRPSVSRVNRKCCKKEEEKMCH